MVTPELVSLLDRQHAFTDVATGREFVVRLLRFLDFVEADVRFGAIVDDMLREVSGSLELFVNGHSDRLAECRRIGNSLAKKVPASLTSGSSAASELWSKKTFDNVVRTSLELSELPDGLKDTTPVAGALWILSIWSKDFAKRSYKKPPQKTAEKIGSRIGAVREAQEAAWKQLLFESSVLGGAAWTRLAELREVVLPENTNPYSFPASLMRYVRSKSGFRGPLVHLFAPDDGDAPSQAETKAALTLARIEFERLYHELRTRIGQRASHLALIYRFKQRSEWYDAARLRGIVNKNSRKGEDMLSMELAHYLFEQGLNPLLRSMMGDLQPDIVDLGQPRLYVESKRYSAGSKSYLIKGMHQVWDTLGTTRGTHFECRQAFFAVFRLGGPRYVFPSVLRSEGAEVHPVLIDIAEPATKGSKQKHRPVVLDEAALLPSR